MKRGELWWASRAGDTNDLADVSGCVEFGVFGDVGCDPLEVLGG
jgi:hypothetical protein